MEMKNQLRQLAESAERRAKEHHEQYLASLRVTREHSSKLDLAAAEQAFNKAAGFLNDFFYWTGYKNAYRGIIAMVEMNEVVEAELDETPSCP